MRAHALAATIAKSAVGYACQWCGSTELVQAHHRVPEDDSSLVVLCTDCHCREHPDVPKALFFSVKTQQPYWWNKSASSVSKGLFVHPRTVIRVARMLGIDRGVLSLYDELLLEDHILHLPKQIVAVRTGEVGRPKGSKSKNHSGYARRTEELRRRYGEDVFRRWGARGGNPALVKEAK